MHYCILVITNSFPTTEVLQEAMGPFNEENFYEQNDTNETTHPAFLWEYWTLGGRYGALLHIDVSGENQDKYELRFYADKPRVNRLFRSAFLETLDLKDMPFLPFTESLALCYMGFRDGVIYADSAKIADLKKYPEAFGVVLPSGEAFVREYWNGNSFDEDDYFDEKQEKAFSDFRDCWVSVVDIHD